MELLITTQKFWFIHSKLEFFELRFKFKNTDYYISRHKLIENKKKSCLYALIWDYSFINFQQKVPPIRLFSPIFLLIFKEFSHLYFYSDPSSIRNSRVHKQGKLGLKSAVSNQERVMMVRVWYVIVKCTYAHNFIRSSIHI